MKIIKTIFSDRVCSEGEGQLVQWFPKDNCKPDIWAGAGAVGVGGDGAQVPLR